MARYERSIRIAFDKISGEVLEADEVFKSAKPGFEIRKQFHTDELDLFCCECHQELGVSTSKYDRLHFKHHKKADYCILKDEHLSPADVEAFTRILKAKESQRHKELKHKIAERISKIEGIEIDSIAIDNKYIIRDSEKRRPDVYCKYRGKELVFEIQLSQLSLRYILSRYEFYRKHGIYLVWILDNFDVRDQSQLERDIKYLTNYQNFFKLDEQVEEFKLSCEYKFPFLTSDHRVLTKWLTRSVHLDEINFDETEYQIYFFDFTQRLQDQQVLQKIKAEEQREAERKRLEQIREDERIKEAALRKSQIEGKCLQVINEIKRLRSFNSQNFSTVRELLFELDEEELESLNSRLNLNAMNKNGEPVFFKWLNSARAEEVAFLDFILRCSWIEFDVNLKDANGGSAFQQIINNASIASSKYTTLKALFTRDYIFTNEDEAYLKALKNDHETESEILVYSLCSSLQRKHLTEQLFSHAKLICILYSARENKIIGFRYKPTEWIAFANNAVEYYKEYWEYIELTFKHYGLWETLIKADRKGTFQKKVAEFYASMPEQKFDFDSAFRYLFPQFSRDDFFAL